MTHDLTKVANRDRLKIRRDPYWMRLRKGCFIGYRVSTIDNLGIWNARVFDTEKQKYLYKSLGDFGDLAANERFAIAKKQAEAFADLIDSGGVLQTKIETVADACRDYASSRPEAMQRFKRYIYDDTLGNIKLDKLRRRHLMDWRKRLIDKPSLVSRNKNSEQRVRQRAASTVNRDMAILRAALNKVKAHGTPNTDAAWQEALKAIPNANGQRNIYLDLGERRKLLEHLSLEAAPFFKALCLLPLRPGAMAGLIVSDYDKRTCELSIGKDKTGRPRRIQLPHDAAQLFEKQTKDKLPSAPLFMRSNGKQWDKESWKRPIADAVKLAGFENGPTAYVLRHSTITDLVIAGLPLLTIAQISGTSAEMIERHYGHLKNDAAIEALNKLSL